MPNLFKGLCQERMKVKISSVISLEFDFTQDDNRKDSADEFLDSLKSDMW
jgi:hypothetical protein